MEEIDKLLDLIELKDIERTGWELRKVEDPESVADHSWGTALLVTVFGDDQLDMERCLKMAAVHDIAEVEIGDIVKRGADIDPEMSEEEKHSKEAEFMEEMSDKLSVEIERLWREYQERKTPEAKFVKDMDLIELCLQALKYEKEDRYDPEEENKNFQEFDNMDEFFATSEPRLRTEKGKSLFDQIKSRYESVKRD